jgi:hypothetical protein
MAAGIPAGWETEELTGETQPAASSLANNQPEAGVAWLARQKAEGLLTALPSVPQLEVVELDPEADNSWASEAPGVALHPELAGTEKGETASTAPIPEMDPIQGTEEEGYRETPGDYPPLARSTLANLEETPAPTPVPGGFPAREETTSSPGVGRESEVKADGTALSDSLPDVPFELSPDQEKIKTSMEAEEGESKWPKLPTNPRLGWDELSF